MKIFVGIVLALACVSANQNLEDLINEINSKQNLWTAGINFNGTPIANLTHLLGGRKVPDHIAETVPFLEHEIDPAAIPVSFDSRAHWSSCRSIREIRNQGGCGSCWAVAATSIMSDRHCIHSKGRVQPEISARYAIACDPLSIGCDGGMAYNALILWRDHGVVTGGDYGTNIGCQPYPYHLGIGELPGSGLKYDPKLKCVQKCDNPSLVFNKELYHGLNMYRIQPKNEAQIQAEIMKNGPVTAGMTAYDELFAYKSGVYVPVNLSGPGGHIVRIIGWGVEGGKKYWLVANSWSENWGDHGLLKILRGQDTCGIETDIYAGIPK